MKTFKVAVEWVVCGTVEVEAENIEQAMTIANEDSEIGLPDGDYVEGSWLVNEDMGLQEAIN